ncbi:hypothetical protein EV127DRAFT_490148 [Xylaria flabelliformis]|nr:hypothetical protein EV127DRAFT_490148 [Xylaria flabelliformis]
MSHFIGRITRNVKSPRANPLSDITSERETDTSLSSQDTSRNPPYSSQPTFSVSGASNVQQLVNPHNIQSSSGGFTSQNLPVPPKMLFRRDLVPEDYSDPTEPSLEQPVNIGKEVLRRQQESLAGWQVLLSPIEELTLSQKIIHPQVAQLHIDKKASSKESTRPRYPYDRHLGKVVPAKDFMFEDGFVAISYAWGRFRFGEPGKSDKRHQRDVPGCLWPVPIIELKKQKYPYIKSKFDIEELMGLLRRMPGRRYFWVDVLCINQYPKTKEEMAEEKEEIDKQAAIFADAAGVLVYLWSLDAEELKAAMEEFEQAWRWYWELTIPREGLAATATAGAAPCTDRYGVKLRDEPWFSAAWTYQEMKLAPHSVWMSRDGAHCRLGGRVLTTHTVAQKFNDLIYREKQHDPLHINNDDPYRSQFLSNLPETEKKSRDVLLTWLHWAERKTGVTINLGESRAQMLQAVTHRAYNDSRRDAPFMGALQISQDVNPNQSGPYIDGIPLYMWHQILRDEGGRIFDSHHPSVMSNMLPGPANFVSKSAGIRAACSDWTLKDNGQLRIPQGTSMCDLNPDNETEYQLSSLNQSVYGGDPETIVKDCLKKHHGIHIKHVKFVIINYQTPLSRGYPPGSESMPISANPGQWVFTAVRAVILVTESSHAESAGSLWYKVGMVSSKNFRQIKLTHDITVGYNYKERK